MPRVMKARLAPALVRLRLQIDERLPGRPSTHDGWIGDRRHAARKSDHNPSAAGWVRALDITDGPHPAYADGIGAWLVLALLHARDPRISYIIHDRRIYSGTQGPLAWYPRLYQGSNPHTAHVHISVRPETSFCCDPAPWVLQDLPDAPAGV